MKRLTRVLTRPETVLALAIAWPFLNFVQANYRQMFITDFLVIVTAFLIFFAIGVAVAYAVRRVAGARAGDFTAYGGSAFAWIFLNYQPIADTLFEEISGMLGSLSINYVYLLIAGLTFVVGGTMSRKRETRLLFASFCLIVCISATFSFVINVVTRQDAAVAAKGSGEKRAGVTDQSRNGFVDSHWLGLPLEYTGDTPAHLPNIYYLILDEYARTDQLAKLTGFDDSPTMEALEAHGFRIFDRAFSNFPMTFLSLSTSLGMSYAAGTGAMIDTGPYLKALQGSNAAVRTFKALGYSYLHLPSNQWGASQCGDKVDVCMVAPKPAFARAVEKAWETINLLVRMTPVAYFLRINVIAAEYDPALMDKIIDFWPDIEKRQPSFIFAHTLPPHLPFIFKPDCTRQDRFSLDLTSNGGNYRQLYVENLRCASSRMLVLADYLVKTDPDAIIIFQSDHGSQFTWRGGTDSTANEIGPLRERLAILLAVRAPARCLQTAYDEISPVNILRFAFGCVTGQAPPYIDDRHYPLHSEAHNYYRIDEQVSYSTLAGSP